MPARRFGYTVVIAALLVAGQMGCRKEVPYNAFDKGILALEHGRYDEAVPMLEAATREHAENASAFAHLGIAYWKQGKLDLATDSFKRAVSLAPNDSQPLEYLGCVYMTMQRWVEAREALRMAYNRAPKSPRVVTALALAELHTTGADSGKAYLLYALSIDPLYPPALYDLALVERDWLDHPADAAVCFRKYLDVAPDGPYVKAAKNALAAGKTQPRGVVAGHDAVAPQTKVVESPRKVISSKSATAAAAETALPTPKRLHFRGASEPDSRSAVDAFNMGMRFQKVSDWNRAIYYYTRAIENDNTFLNAYYNLGLVYRATGDFERARDAFLYALRIKPDMASTLYMLALSYRDLNQDAKAVQELKAALKIDPDNAEAHLLLGLIYQKNSATLALARDEFLRYVELAPTGHAAREARQWLDRHEAR